MDPMAALKGKAVALYFSAHWCPPCKRFTPILKDLYEEVNADDKQFEVIFVSSDEDEAARTKYMEEMHGDWLMCDWGERDALKQKFGCFAAKEQEKFPDVQRRNGIPALVIVNPDGSEVVFGDAACLLVEKQGPIVVTSWPKW